MRLNRIILKAALCAAAVLAPAGLMGQGSSLNTFSPYSFYGIGDISTQGTAAQRGMGGVGLGFHSWMEMNYLNPASYGYVNQRSALLSVGGYGQNYYLSQTKDSENLKSSYNTFNLSDIGFSIPLAKNLGLGVVVAPYSSVGYRLQIPEEHHMAEIGPIYYTYQGSGGVTQFKVGLGWRFLDRISIGADLLYLHGNIERYFGQTVTVITGEGNYQGVTGQKTEQINTVLGIFGLQADIIRKTNMLLTFGATYQMGGDIKGRVTDYIGYTPGFYTGSSWSDATRFTETLSEYSMPHIISAGLFLNTPKWGVGADYVYSMWGSVNSGFYTNNVAFRDTHTIKVGGKYTPNPGDIRRKMNRWTYRAGFTYSNYYMFLNQGKTPINEGAITFGIGIPLSSTALNRLDLGLELGTRGTKKDELIKSNFLKFSVAFTLFGEDFWFVKHKYD